MQLMPSVVLVAAVGTWEGGVFSFPRTEQPDMPSEIAAYNVGYTTRRPCDVRPEDADLGLELDFLGVGASLRQQVWGGKKGSASHRMEIRPF